MITLDSDEQKLLEEALANGARSPQAPRKIALQSTETTIQDLRVKSVEQNEPPKSLVQSNDPSANASSFSPNGKYFTLLEAFPNAAVFLMFFDSSLRTGKKSLYPWQIEELLRLSTDKGKWRIDNKLQYYLLANNGSGKDAFIIAGLVCFILCCWRRYKVIITSSSDNQLDTQTRVYIRDLAMSVNAYLRTDWGWTTDAIDIKAESFKATRGFSGTEVYTFVSKEGGKVEGYHPFPDADPGEGCIVIVNEGKSIPEEIHLHLKKCTYNMWLEVSSAGEQSGEFYKATTSERTIHYPREPEAFRPFCRTITYRDTPHKIREAEEEILALGLDHPFVKNTYLSKFSSLGELVAITEIILDKCLSTCNRRIIVGMGRHAGLDFAAGGDECSFIPWDENELLAEINWRVKDTEKTIDILIGADDKSIGLFQQYGFTKETAYKITGDDNGLGEPIINSLHRRGWAISRIKNQGAARRKDRFLNRGAEIYSSLARIIEGCFLNFNGKLSAKAKRQLITRHYTVEGQGKFKLIPKEDETESPDRADAIVLAWSQWTILDFLDDKVKKEQPRTSAPMLTQAEILKKGSKLPEHQQRWELEKMLGIQAVPPPAGVVFKSRSNPITALRTLYNN